MADIAQLEQAFRKAHAAGNTEHAQRFADAIRSARASAPQETQQPIKQQSGGDIQGGVMTALQGAGLGFMDELAGIGGAIAGKAFNLAGVGDNKTFAEDYRTIRDKYRGDVETFAKENPKSALALSIAGSLPTAVGAAPALAMKAIPSVVRPAAQAATMGAGYGAASGLGSSQAEDVGGMLTDAARGAIVGGVTGGISQPAIAGIGAVGKNIGQRFNQNLANEAARIKLAEALSRDVRGSADHYAQAAARMSKMGDEAAIADIAGENTRGLLDTLATLPGKTKESVANLIHQRQATRAGRMFSSADEALGTQGKKASALTKDLIEQRSKEAAPLYDIVRNAPVTVDNEVASLLSASSPFHAEAEKLALMKGTPLNLEKVQPGDQIPLAHLDMLKQTLFDVADAAKRSGQKQMGAAADNLRVRLTQKLDAASPKDQSGQSIYKMARDTFAGHSETLNAIDAGKNALKEGAEAIQDMTAGMSKAELDAFRVGALQSLREKVGSQAGQTQMMKMWQEPNTSEKLKQIFGNDYRRFAADVAREARLKKLEGVGKGSQTAARQFAAGDLDKLPTGEIGNALANAKVGNIAGLISSATNVWNQVKMPEQTRNALGDLLMKKGEMGKKEINELRNLMSGLQKKQASRAGSIGAELGYQFNK